MAGRKVIFANDEYYHVFNRGIARQPIFFSKRDYERFLLTLKYYRFSLPPMKLSRLLELSLDQRNPLLQELESVQTEQLVRIVSFILMPNHFHLLVKQVVDRGISTFLNKVANSYTRYVNTKQDRVGDLFQGVFKAVHIETDEQLIHVSRYIHLNPLVSFVVKNRIELLDYPWSSLLHYQKQVSSWVDTSAVLASFKSSKQYLRFVLDQTDYIKKLEQIKHITFES